MMETSSVGAMVQAVYIPWHILYYALIAIAAVAGAALVFAFRKRLVPLLRFKFRRVLKAAAVLSLVIGAGFAGYYFGSGNQNIPHGYQLISMNVKILYCSASGLCVDKTNHNTIPQYGGGNYTQVKLFAPGNYVKYGTAAQDEVQFIALSTNSSTLAQGNVNIFNKACDLSDATSEVTGNGLTRAQGTLTLSGTPFGPSPMTITLAKTFSATGTQNNIQRTCEYNTGTVNTPQVPWAVAQFSVTNMANGDTLTITWTDQITYT